MCRFRRIWIGLDMLLEAVATATRAGILGSSSKNRLKSAAAMSCMVSSLFAEVASSIGNMELLPRTTAASFRNACASYGQLHQLGINERLQRRFRIPPGV